TKSAAYFFFRLSGQGDGEGFVEAVRPVGQPDRRGQDDQLLGTQVLLQTLDHLGRSLVAAYPLLGEAEHRFLQVAVGAALLMVRQVLDLLVTQTGLTTK